MLSLVPATHIYCCWEGFSTEDMQAIAKRFNESHTARAITVVQRSMLGSPVQYMADLGFEPLTLLANAKMNMSGVQGLTTHRCIDGDREGAGAGFTPVASSLTHSSSLSFPSSSSSHC